jgi:hypothetical protein
MATEIELKLRLDPSDIGKLAAWLDQNTDSGQPLSLQNDYFDTPELALAAAHAALRIRSTQQGYEQTFKARSASSQGIQVRHEWNWPLVARELDTDLLTLPEVQAQWPSGIALDDSSPLHAVFSTDFERRHWLFHDAARDAVIEIVIDEGQILAGGEQEPLCEIELELQSGPAEAMWPLLEDLHKQVPLWLSDISKAERGYRLAGVAGSRFSDDPVDESGEGLMSQVFNLQRALEYRLWSNASVSDIWLYGYPLFCALVKDKGSDSCNDSCNDKHQPLRRLLESTATSPEAMQADRISAAELSVVVKDLSRVCTESQLRPGDWYIRWCEARRRVADVIECNNESTRTASLLTLVKD